MITTAECIKAPSIKYPCLKRFCGNDGNYDLIILFTDSSKGSLIHINKAPCESKYKLGEYRTDWNENSCTIYDGKVTLSN